MKLTMKKFLIFSFTFLFVIGISIDVFADTAKSAKNLFYVGDSINETVDGKSDVYAAGDYINLSGNVEAEVIVAGNNINISVENVGGSVRAVGSTLNIDSKINRNITAIGSIINIESNTKAEGVYIIGGSVNFSGKSEDIYIIGGKVELNGVVTGNLNIKCSELVIGENARVYGDFKLESENYPTVLGDFDTSTIDFEKIDVKDNYSSNFKWGWFLGKVISIITSIMLAVLITLLCKKYLSNSYERLVSKPWLPFIVGFATLIIVPILAIILCFTVVCIPVSVISILIYSILIYISPVISGILVGRIVFKNINKYLSGIVLTIIIKLLTFIPYVGAIVVFACLLLSLGLFVENIFYIISEKQS